MRRKLTLVALALAGLIGLISAGCGSNESSETGAAGSTPTATTSSRADKKLTARDKAVKFADCVRAHGVSDFPDPDASGELTIDGVANRSSVDTNTAEFKSAIGACKDLQPSGFMGRRRTAHEQQNALEFAQCVRDHGVKDFPDPVNGEPLVNTYKIPSSNEPGGMAILNAAMKKCGVVMGGALGGQR